MIDFSSITTISDADVMIGRLTTLRAKYNARKSGVLEQLSNSQSSTSYQSQIATLQKNIDAMNNVIATKGPNAGRTLQLAEYQSEMDKLVLSGQQLQVNGLQAKLEFVNITQGTVETYDTALSELATYKATLTT